jgi:hypothetical protein
VEPANESVGLRIESFNGELRSARVPRPGTIELAYKNSARALAVLNGTPSKITIDGTVKPPVLMGEHTIALPRGQHIVTIE